MVLGVSYSGADSQTVVTDAAAGNSAPYGLQLTPASVIEEVPGASVGPLVVLDPDPADTHSYVVSDPRFGVVGGALVLLPGQSVDFEVEASVNLTITVRDGALAPYSQVFSITVVDVNEAPTDIVLASQTLVADLLGAVVGAVSVADPDAGDTHSYTVDDPRFEIVAGQLKLVDGESLSLGSIVSVTITATDSGGLFYTEIFPITATPPGGGAGVNASISVLQNAPGLLGTQGFAVGASQCDAGSGLVDLPTIFDFSQSALALPGSVDLLATTILKSGDALFIQVIDADANFDAAMVDRVVVELDTPAMDVESITVAETGINTGIFVGYIQSLPGVPNPGNCVIEIDAPQNLTVRYSDVSDPLDTVSAVVLVDPFSVVFDSATGNLINGARITLIDVQTNMPAQVRADDGLSSFPSTVDSGSEVYNFSRGSYRFPVNGAGDYVLEVVPPNRFAHPTSATDAQLQILSGAPYALGPGARGQTFQVPVGPAMRVDIPLDLLPLAPSLSSLELFAALSPGSSSVSEYVSDAQCFDGSGFVPSPAANSLVQGPLSLPANLTLTPAGRFARGDVVLIKLTDTDQDLDPFAVDTVIVDVVVPGTSETERVRLFETNDSTGIFSGYLSTALSSTGSANNCQLEAAPSASIEVRYQDVGDAADATLAQALFDPGFTVFSSADGDLVSGATVTLIDASSGLPATNAVFSLDGTTSYPATVTVGDGALDGAGQRIDFSAGTFLFPSILPGDYRFEVTVPVSYEFPSLQPDSVLNALPGGPYVLVPGSRGSTFNVVAGVPPAFDIPLDPINAEVFVTKQASKDVAGIGDFVQYQVQVENGDASGTISNVVMVDRLPLGFRYVTGSLKVDGQAADNLSIAADGRQLRIPLSDMAPAESRSLRYVAEITAGAKLGQARNEATVVGTGIGRANTAFADVQVKEDLMQSKAIVVGQVFASGCDAQDASGMADVRIWLEDGTFVVTDREGKFHIEGIEPGTHVVQLDQASLPDSHELATCVENTRFAGQSHSQFVDLTAGTLWRTDFYLAPKPNQVSNVVSVLDAEAVDGVVHYTYRVDGGGVPLENMRVTLMLDDQLAFIGGSARVNGAVVHDPSGVDMGAPTFKLEDTHAAFNNVIEFDAFVKYPRGLIESKAVAMFASAAGNHRSDVNVSELSLNWPSSLIIVAESIGSSSSAVSASRAGSITNRQALRSARLTNADKLPGHLRSEAKPSQGQPRFSVQSEVHEPSKGSHRARSNVARTHVSIERPTTNQQPYELPKLDRGEAPPFDLSWLAANKDNHGIAWPPERYNPSLPAIEVTVVHKQGLKPVLLVDGVLANAVTYEGTTTHHELGVSFSRWDNVTISEHDSLIEARLLDNNGQTVQAYERAVHFSGAPARAELVESESHLVADGLYAPVVAIRLYDRAGYPLRSGTTGEFNVLPPYVALDKAKHLETLDNSLNNQRYRVLRDGIAYIQLEPTTTTGEVELDFQFDPVRQDKVRARMVPGARDWIMVGLLEGSYAQNDLTGNVQSLGSRNLEDESLSDGRVAFYAKGMVKGDWLLTMAYDTDKKFERRLRDQIDPNQFYTLYGDGTEQLYDAESQRKLYLKLERSRFSGLFGDFDTSFERSELARYDRRMNGLNMGYFGERVTVNAFVSETDQAYIRDELRGDGTSGVYRLSNKRVVVNSEAVRIVTRDRFDTQNILEEEALTRFLDYTIDYDRGTLIFKQPVFSQDGGFNPIFIEVEYEVADEGAGEEIVAGTRLAYRLDNEDSEVAITYIDDGTAGQGGNLLAADLTWQYNAAQKLTVELAQTDTDLQGKASGYLVEIEHATEKLAGRAYAREQEQAFGLGNQSVLEAGTRKIGIEGEYRLSQDLLIRGQSFQQTALDQDAERLVVNALGEWHNKDTKLTAGLQGVSEDTAAGERADATQVLFGVAQTLLRKKLVLRGDTEIDISSGDSNADYPSRAIFGAEYEVFKDISLLAEQELSWGDTRDTQDTRFGVRARPWTGADLNSIVTREQGENGERLFATTGLLQQWRINERWLYDVGFDRVQTLTESGTPQTAEDLLFNPRVPPASGSFDGDFSAFYTGFGYRHDAWDVSSRIEMHAGDVSDKWNFLVGANHQLDDGKVIAASMAVINEESADGAVADNTDFRVGFAWRPFDSAWSLLNRTDLVFEARENDVFDTRTRKWVNNFNANYKTDAGHQLALQLGLKYVVEDIDGDEYDSTTALYGLEYRYDLTAKWDLSVRSSALQSFGADAVKYSYGASIGHNLMPNMWVSVGYNVEGFEDDDFVAADYTAKGPFLKLRMKFDQALAERFLEFAGLGAGRRDRSFANGR